jgi:hypothetical protein
MWTVATSTGRINASSFPEFSNWLVCGTNELPRLIVVVTNHPASGATSCRSARSLAGWLRRAQTFLRVLASKLLSVTKGAQGIG